MRIHYCQHVPFEDLGAMFNIFAGRGDAVTCTHLYRGEALPPLDAFDALVVMGGPMGVHDDDKFPWLTAEKTFIRHVIDNSNKPVLGVCLGAQLIAHCLGAEVSRNAHREIGWFPITLDRALMTTPWGSLFDSGTLMAFHWHGDTFTLPAGAVPFGATEACHNQGFIIEDRIVGFQFHLETTPASAQALLDHCADELDGSAYVQSAEQIMDQGDHFAVINGAIATITRHWLSQV